ncbi:hypothetical protein SAMN06265222_10283 [Neorhodopirellula lusitana]|uniref:Uncharacterized protein n=1 Tax=Neorhodopirellula lusitana TaxID=445327 RepID=A0ABY1PT66_9BACT|nr:hypothetical protein [Neorhodopirellula lusitana]SMP46190.1 hypothetical protein SAMN06265222_10283 [Neorhodopirellula lusitana]
MPLQEIEIPDSIKQLEYSSGAEHLIDTANEAIEAFMLADQTVIENFVTCDFHLVDQAISWIEQNHLLTGDRFCEWGAGFGVAAMLAALRGMQAVGIEIDQRLVNEANAVAESLDNPAQIHCGSFVPRDVEGLDEVASEVRNVDTDEDDMYDEIGIDIEDFDLFFAFPWPGEHGFFEHIFEACAASGSLLLTYRGREGMNLVQKV